MDLFRSLRKGQADSASAETTPGNVLLPVNSNAVDDQVVRLACTLVRRQQRCFSGGEVCYVGGRWQ